MARLYAAKHKSDTLAGLLDVRWQLIRRPVNKKTRASAAERHLSRAVSLFGAAPRPAPEGDNDCRLRGGPPELSERTSSSRETTKRFDEDAKWRLQNFNSRGLQRLSMKLEPLTSRLARRSSARRTASSIPRGHDERCCGSLRAHCIARAEVSLNVAPMLCAASRPDARMLWALQSLSCVRFASEFHPLDRSRRIECALELVSQLFARCS